MTSTSKHPYTHSWRLQLAKERQRNRTQVQNQSESDVESFSVKSNSSSSSCSSILSHNNNQTNNIIKPTRRPPLPNSNINSHPNVNLNSKIPLNPSSVDGNPRRYSQFVSDLQQILYTQSSSQTNFSSSNNSSFDVNFSPPPSINYIQNTISNSSNSSSTTSPKPKSIISSSKSRRQSIRYLFRKPKHNFF